MNKKEFKLGLGKQELIVQVRKLAERANGEVLVRYGDTLVLATCVMASQESENAGFFPLTVNYEERYYAAGKIKGPRYIKREGRPSDEAVINSRLIDRAIRPRFPKELRRAIQVIITCLSWDGENDPDILGLIATSIALSISDIPWSGPISTVRIGTTDNGFVLNPTYEELEESKLDFILAGIEDSNDLLINMIECRADEVDEEVVMKGLEFGEQHLKQLMSFQKEIIKEIGKEKAKIEGFKDPKVEKEIKSWLDDKLEKAIYQKTTLDREEELNKLKKDFSDFLEEKYSEPKEIRLAYELLDKETDRVIHKNITDNDKRPDNRKLDEIRELQAEAGLIPRSHGSGLFSRGLTRSLSILTLGAPGDQQTLEGMEIVGKKRFMHHYNFPPYSAGEVRPLRAPGRREIGHGTLAERALLPLIPSFDDFPYTIRIVSEILSSNGSSSMAAVSSSSLALMDAGIPIKRPVAGIALGLIMRDKDNYKILTDIQGPEDHHGDMDFKVAGTQEGVTAIQMDVKIPGITKKIIQETLTQAKKARLEILGEIQKVLTKPRDELSPWAPRIYTLQIKPEKIGDVIGSGGKTIRKLTEEYEVSIDIEEDGKIFITAEKEEKGKKVISLIKKITREIKIGESFQGEVKKVLDFGAFVEILPGQEGLIHSSRFKKVSLEIGDVVSVKVSEIDQLGRINLSLVKVVKTKRG
jgi:polyribonucleotide nucleotidyltransferase